jgi:heme-degrading monooxygenase HmoA
VSAVSILSYLRFALADDADLAVFQRDLDRMEALARQQPGFRWAEVARSASDGRVWVVISEWDDVEQVRAWEHHPEHEALYKVWEPHYREEFIHRRFVPWQRPPKA